MGEKSTISLNTICRRGFLSGAGALAAVSPAMAQTTAPLRRRSFGAQTRLATPGSTPVITPAETSTTLFIDAFGSTDSIETINSFSEFHHRFGEMAAPDAYEQIRLYFLNGGRKAIISSVDNEDLSSFGGTPGVAGVRNLFDRGRMNIDFIAAPIAARMNSSAAAAIIYAEVLFVAQQQKAIVLIDAPRSTDTTLDVGALQSEWVSALNINHPNAAIYAPQLQPASFEGTVGASGAIAGVAARIDSIRGLWKAPAGMDAAILGAVPAQSIDASANDELTGLNVNSIRTFAAAGSLIWGARTASADPEWKYVPVRRTALFFEKSITAGLDWTISEANNDQLWRTVASSVENFMASHWRAGALQGAKAEDAFFVRCDRTTTTQAEINNGVFNVVVGFAPLKPAEFIILQLTQKAAV